MASKRLTRMSKLSLLKIIKEQNEIIESQQEKLIEQNEIITKLDILSKAYQELAAVIKQDKPMEEDVSN